MILIFLVVLLIAAVLRGYQLATPSYWMDEGFSISTAQEFWQQFNWVRSPLYHFLLGLVGWASHWNIWALRSLSVVLGLLMLAAGYYTAKRWFNERAALWFSILLAVVSLEVAWSRQVRMYLLLQLCIWLALYCYYQWRHHQLRWYWLALVILATIGSHEFGWIVLLFFVWYECLQRFKVLYPLFVVGSLVVAYIGYHIVFPNAPYINYWWQYWYWIVTNYGLLLPLAALGVATHPQYSKLLNWLAIIWLGWVACLSFIVPLLQYRYLFMTFPIILLMAALGLFWLWRQRWFGKMTVGLCVSILIWQQTITIVPKTIYLLEADSATSPFVYKSFTPQPDFKHAYSFIDHYLVEHPDVQVVDPYPAIHQLYRGTLPTATVFVNFTGSHYVTIPQSERYTGMQYSTLADLQLLGEQHKVLLVLDEFAEYRLDPSIKPFLAQAKVIWQADGQAWSDITVYQFGN